MLKNKLCRDLGIDVPLFAFTNAFEQGTDAGFMHLAA